MNRATPNSSFDLSSLLRADFQYVSFWRVADFAGTAMSSSGEARSFNSISFVSLSMSLMARRIGLSYRIPSMLKNKRSSAPEDWLAVDGRI
jgi:hypothetical protein